MYDVNGRTLVFVTQTHHPVLEHHTGYIYAEYDFHYHKPRELFFTHYWEVYVYALHVGAKIVMDPTKKPDIVTALDYVLNAEDDSRFNASIGRTGEGLDAQLVRRMKRGKGPARDADMPATDVQAWEAEEEKGTGLGAEFGEIGDVDYFGD